MTSRLAELNERSRAIAEREASRLARPDRPSKSRALPHASKKKSAVLSTPFGMPQRTTTADGDDGEDGDIEEWCGPFSVARQMIAARDEARRKREAEQAEASAENDEPHHPLDDLVNESKLEKKRKEQPSMNWRPDGTKLALVSGTNNYYSKRRRRLALQRRNFDRNGGGRVPSLFRLCVKFLIDNFSAVEELGPAVDSTVRSILCNELVTSGAFNGAAFDVLAETGVETLEIIDCAPVSKEQLAEALARLIPAGLKALLLNHCGRCFEGTAVAAVVALKDRCELSALSLGGAYLLSDERAAELIRVLGPTLSSVEFFAGPLLAGGFCESLTAVSHLLELSLADLGAVEARHLMALGTHKSRCLRRLQNLKLQNMKDVVDDAVIERVLSAVDPGNLEGLHLSNVNITDATLSFVRKHNTLGKLKSLELSQCLNLTSAGLETFFTGEIKGLPDPPVLKRLNLGLCHGTTLSDEVIQLAMLSSTRRQLRMINGVNSLKSSGALARGGIVQLDISKGCGLTDQSMESLATYCQHSLVELNMSFCPRISDKGLGYLVEKVEHQFCKLIIWGCAQITEEFLDGHARVGDDESGLEIIGAWMKKRMAK